MESSVPGRGRVWTFTVIRYPPEGFENEAPYVVAIVEIENGPRVIGRVMSSSPEEVKIGSEVELTGNRKDVLEFRVVSEQVPIPK